jgi:hypothetical protein
MHVWSTEKVDQLMDVIESGGKLPRGTRKPFYDGNPQWKLGNTVFNYTDDELGEIKKCAKDITYFAENYCVVMTDEGLQRIKLRDYQIDMLKHFVANRFSVCLASRQIGKCSLHSTLIYIKKDDIEYEMKIFEFWYMIIQNSNVSKKYKIINSIKYRLYKLYSILDDYEKKIRKKH